MDLDCIEKSPSFLYQSEKHEDTTPSRINLATSEDVRREMAKVYRDSRYKKIAPSEGTRLVYMLSQILKAHEVFVLEKKLSELELIAPRGT
jgi:hypothetical protein